MIPTDWFIMTELSWLTIAAGLAGVAMTSSVVRIIYRLFFHPLASYPGPFLARCTSWYAAYQSYTGNIHLDIEWCHEKYGDVVRYRPNGLLVNTIEGLQDAYINPTKTQKSEGYFSFRGDGAISILNAITKEEHAPRRRILSRAFSVAALQKYEPMVIKTAKAFCDSLLEPTTDSVKDTQGKPVHNIGQLSSYFTYDVMSNVAFHSPQDLIKQTHGRSIVKGIDSAMFICGMSLEQPLLVRFPLLNLLLNKRHIKESRLFFDKAKGFAAQRIALEQETHIDDIFGTLLTDEKAIKGLSPEDLASDALVMMIAGTDTSSVALSGFFFYLTRHSKAYKQLAAEIRNTFQDADEIRPGPKLNSCTYLRACIDESMRLAPPVAAPLWREMRQKDQIASMVLPKGTNIATCIYSIHRNPAYFANPKEFRPERWLENLGSDPQADLARRAFSPFSVGSRGCIGKNLAYMEMTILLALLMYKADWEIPEGLLGKVGESDPEKGLLDFKLKGHFTSEKDGPYVKFVPRLLQ
ncbi:hypothetical protein M3J09_012277 [Ascochyta lentis]